MAKKLFYKIGEACKKVDVQPYVLRYWETEFDLLSPDKSSSGQRVYTEQDLAIIRRIKELLYDEGYTTVGAKKKLQSEMADPDSPIGSSRRSSSGDAPKQSKTSKKETKKTGSSKTSSAASSTTASSSAESSEGEGMEAEGDGAASKEASPVKASSQTAGKPTGKGGSGAGDQALREGVEAALEQARSLLEMLRSRSA